MSLEDIDDLSEEITEKQEGHIDDHKKIVRGLKSIKEKFNDFVNKSTVPVNGDDYGIKRDGSTDDTLALDAAFAAVNSAAASASVFGATATLNLRAGRYVDSKQRVFNSRVVIKGEGPLNTIFYRKNGSSGDYLTFNNQYSGIEGVSIDGNRMNCPSGGDLVVFNAYRNHINKCHLRNSAGNGLTIGKTAGSLGVHVDSVAIGQCTGYGMFIGPDYQSTDGIFTGMDIGQCGLSGIRISTGAQNLSMVHSWGNGLESLTDNHGVYIDSPGNVLVGFQGETNLGSGAFITGSSHGNQLTSPKLWGNMKNGLRIIGAPKGAVDGGAIYRNGCGNTTSINSEDFSGICNSGSEWAFSGVTVWDDSSSVPSGYYVDNSGNPGNIGYIPTYPFPGRTEGVRYQSYNYAELTGADYNTLSGCLMRKENTLSQISYLIVAVSNKMSHSVNHFGASAAPTRSVVSGAVRFPPEADMIFISSTQSISSIAGGYPGRRCTFIFSSTTPGSVIHSTALQLSGSVDWTPPRWATLTVAFDGTNWFEVGRKS